MNDRWHELLAAYQTAQLSDSDHAELEDWLRTSPEARTAFHRACRIDEQLRSESEKIRLEPVVSEKATVERPNWALRTWSTAPRGIAAAVALSLLSVVAYAITVQPRVIATLISSENAAWQSELPTLPGSSLTKGYLNLTSGIATIRFDSNVEMTLEAPASLTLKTSSKAFLGGGNILIDATRSSESFALKTPHGSVFLQDARLAIQDDRKGDRTRFELTEGGMLLQHGESGTTQPFQAPSNATMSEKAIRSTEAIEHEPVVERKEDVIQLNTDGKTTTVIRNNASAKWTRPDRLTLRQSNLGNGFDQRALLWFDLSKIDLSTVTTPRLRLNLVETNTGFVSRLPKINRFAVYGFDAAVLDTETLRVQWEEVPLLETGIRVGEFEIPRSQPTGLITLDGASLATFLQAHADREVLLVVLRETGFIEGEGGGRAHAIASDFHPKAAGPVLEFSPKL